MHAHTGNSSVGSTCEDIVVIHQSRQQRLYPRQRVLGQARTRREGHLSQSEESSQAGRGSLVMTMTIPMMSPPLRFCPPPAAIDEPSINIHIYSNVVINTVITASPSLSSSLSCRWQGLLPISIISITPRPHRFSQSIWRCLTTQNPPHPLKTSLTSGKLAQVSHHSRVAAISSACTQ